MGVSLRILPEVVGGCLPLEIQHSCLTGGIITAVSGTYLLAGQVVVRWKKLDPWDLSLTPLLQLIDTEDVETWVNETAHMTKKKQSGLVWKLASNDVWPLSLALLGLLVQIVALIILGLGFWQS